MIKRIKIENYRSFVKAEAELQPFTLVIGANGAGKSNLLRWFVYVGTGENECRHALHGQEGSGVMIEFSNGDIFVEEIDPEARFAHTDYQAAVEAEEIRRLKLPFDILPLFNLNPEAISRPEPISSNPVVMPDGSGTSQVLDSLKNGNREDLFESIEEHFRRYVPEVEKLSFYTNDGKRGFQVRERGLKDKVLPASELSEGTRLILCILTIIHQENPPPVILLEDIDRGMHPRLFEQIAPLMRRIAEEHDINIIATTHNPYLVDAFQDAKESVLIVEKVDGASVLVPLTKKLEELDYDKEEAHVSLGELWYSGLVGGVPLRAKL